MGEFHPLSVDQSTENKIPRIDSLSENRPFLQSSFVKAQPEAPWCDFRRKYCHRRSVCFVVLAALVPFIILRLTFFYGRSIPFLFPASAPNSPLSDEHVSGPDSPGSARQRLDTDADSAVAGEGSQIRPDQDAWTTHDAWYNHTSGNLGNNSKGLDKSRYPDIHVPIAGVPEDNDDEELEDWELYDPNPKDNNAEKSAKSSTETTRTSVPELPDVLADKDSTVGENGVVETNRSSLDNVTGEVHARHVEGNGKATINATVSSVKNVTDDGQIRSGFSEGGDDEAVDPLLTSTTKEPEITECDLFEGEWEPDSQGPLYTNASCFYIQEAQNCMKNGRQDTDYLYWKWKPRNCNLPRFDAASFLDQFRGKTIAFIGDSIARNQMQSLQCMLSQVEIPIETYQSADDRTVRWLYQGHNVTLAVVWSPYLLMDKSDGYKEYQHPVLFLDTLDPAWTSMLQDFDVVVFSIGQWFLKSALYVKQEEVIGCHYCPGFNVTEMGFEESYRLAVREVLGKVVKDFKGIAVMSTFAISHFEGGEWDSGGKCDRKHPLSREEGENFQGMHNIMRAVVLDEFAIFSNQTAKKRTDGFHLDHLDVTKVGLQRADGHPGPYRQFHPFEGKHPGDFVQYDCLHWCIPGPADTWNQLLVEIVKRYF